MLVDRLVDFISSRNFEKKKYVYEHLPKLHFVHFISLFNNDAIIQTEMFTVYSEMYSGIKGKNLTYCNEDQRRFNNGNWIAA